MKLNGTRLTLIVVVIAFAIADYYLLQSDQPVNGINSSLQNFTGTNQTLLFSAGR